jgi:hypothetical protein
VDHLLLQVHLRPSERELLAEAKPGEDAEDEGRMLSGEVALYDRRESLVLFSAQVANPGVVLPARPNQARG